MQYFTYKHDFQRKKTVPGQHTEKCINSRFACSACCPFPIEILIIIKSKNTTATKNSHPLNDKSR